MKKMMMILLCMIMVLLSIAYAFDTKMRDNDTLENFDAMPDALSITIKDSAMEKKVFMHKLEQLSDKYEASIVRTDFKIEHGKNVIYKTGLFAANYFEDTGLKLNTGRYPQQKGETIATFNTNDAHQVGTIKDTFHDIKMIAGGNLNTTLAMDGNTVNGSYTIFTKDGLNNGKVLKEIATMLGFQDSELVKNNFGGDSGAGTFYLLAIILSIFVFAIFCLTNVFYPITRLKEIGVMKLLGYSNRAIWSKLNLQVLLVPLIFGLLICVLQALVIPDAGLAYGLDLLKYILIVLAICLLISLMMIAVVHRLKIAQILKKSFNFKISLYTSYILKFLVFLGLLFIIPAMVKEGQRYYNEQGLKAVYEKQAQYLTLANYDYIGSEFMDSMSSKTDRLGVKLIDMFKELEQTANAGYVHTVVTGNPNGIDEQVQDKQSNHLAYMIANQNYMERTGYHFDKPLNYYFTNKIHVLVPSDMRNPNTTALIKDIIASTYFSKQMDEGKKNFPIQIDYYKRQNKLLFSENLDRAGIENGYIRDPIFICQSSKYLYSYNSFLINSAISNPVRILNNKTNREAIQKAIAHQNLQQNNLKFANMLNSGFAEQIAISQSTTVVWIAIALLALFVSILSSYYISAIIIVSKKQEILVSRLLGHTFFDRYRNEIFYFVALYVFGAAELIVFTHAIIPLLVFFIMVSIDALIMWLLTKRNDQKLLSASLKGEE